MIQNKNYNLFDFIRIPLTVTPVLAVVRMVDKVFYALVPSLTALVPADFINTAQKIFAGEVQRGKIYLPLFLFILIMAHQYVDYALLTFVKTKMNMRMNEELRRAVVTKRAKLEFRHVEDNDTWDIVNRACANPAEKILGGFDILLRMGDMVVRVGSLLFILWAQVWWAGFVIMGFSVPLFFLSVKSGKTNYDAFREATKHQRRADYLQKILTNRENADERTMFAYTDEINKRWYDKFETARKINLKAIAKNYVRMKSASLIMILISLLIAGVLIVLLKNNQLSLGMFIGLTTASFGLTQLVSNELTYVTGELANSREYLRDFSLFSNLSEKTGAIEKPEPIKNFVFSSLEFVNVSFKYPGTHKYILKNLSMRLEAGKHYAFVGVNGAGKTTITKLLTGLYDNYEGEIKINSRSLREYSQSQLKSIFSVVYQDFARYGISLRDNIALGNADCVSDKRILAELEKVGLSEAACQLHDGLDTSLGKIKENSVDLSGGQWQRVALARSLVSNAAVNILDEPTAALDPVAESGIYEMFDKFSSGKTTIFITHRLGAARIADEILVIHNGKVAEAGSHKELMNIGEYCAGEANSNGIYAEMFESQRSWYL